MYSMEARSSGKFSKKDATQVERSASHARTSDVNNVKKEEAFRGQDGVGTSIFGVAKVERRKLSVGVRLRPESKRELRDPLFLSCVHLHADEEGHTVEVDRSFQDTRSYAYEIAYGPEASTRCVCCI